MNYDLAQCINVGLRDTNMKSVAVEPQKDSIGLALYSVDSLL